MKPVVMFFVLLMIMVSSPFRWKVHLPPGNIHGGVGSLSDQVLVRKGVTKDRVSRSILFNLLIHWLIDGLLILN